MAVGKKLRFEVFRRDNFACRYCGRSAKRERIVLEPDHVVPRSRGGKDVATNLVTACEDCNSGKSDTPISAPPIEDVPQEIFRRACAERGVAGVDLESEEPIDVTEEILANFCGPELDAVLKSAHEWLENLDEVDPGPERVREQAAVNAHFEANMRIHGLTSTLQRFLELQPPQVVDALYEEARAHRLNTSGDLEPPNCLVTLEAANRFLQGEDERLLGDLPEQEIVEWLKIADAVYGNTPWGLTDEERAHYAAHAVRLIRAGHRFTALCGARGEHTSQCPEFGEFQIQLNECPGCEVHTDLARPEGHLACGRHVEAIRNGEFVCKTTGVAMSLRDVAPLASDEKEPA